MRINVVLNYKYLDDVTKEDWENIDVSDIGEDIAQSSINEVLNRLEELEVPAIIRLIADNGEVLDAKVLKIDF